MNIPQEVTSRIPLIKPEHMNLLLKLKEHPHSPIWNYTCGDRLNEDDSKQIDIFAEKLHTERKKGNLYPSEEIFQWIENVKSDVMLFRENTKGLDIRKDFSEIKCMSRQDIAASLEKIVPMSVSLERLIVNSTSGTTGHPIITPNHPVAIGYYTPMLLFALERHGINPIFTKDNVGCMLICAQKETAVYSTVVPILNGTGFAKINLDKSSWRKEESAKIYLEDFAPQFLTGDPFSFSEMLNLDMKYKPSALVSTSMEMNSALRKKLIQTYNTKVIDYYSLNETGPLAYSCSHHPEEFHILPTDIFLEITDKEGNSLPENTSGEITVTGGRNPYIPLLRYKTGDRAKLKMEFCSCGDVMPRLYDMEMRKQVLFYNKKNEIVNPIDITRIMKRYPILQYEFKQKKDLTCVLSVRKLHDFSYLQEQSFLEELENLFQKEVDIEIDFKLDTNGGKPLPYESELGLNSN
jgi:phenylacetate-CoA ligase